VTAEDDLKEFIAGISGFGSWSHADKIRLFAWLQHHLRKKTRFTTGDINWCYSTLSFKPSNTSQYLKDMEGKELLKDKNGYYGEGNFIAGYNATYIKTKRNTTVVVEKLLAELPGKIPDHAERVFLEEALICFRNSAFRAAIVMTWNLTYFHLCTYVLNHKLAEFNTEYPIRFAGIHKKAKAPTIAKYEDFEADLKESEVIAICKSANIITQEQFKALDRQIGRRNDSAHPSMMVITYLQAEECIHDLVANVVLTIIL
jgi:hypothetical protein